MKAWQFTGTNEPLVLADLPAPEPAPDEVLVRIKAAGLCHSDVGILEVDGFPLPAKSRLPVTLGHEVAGEIVQLGAEVGDWQVGDRVGIGNVGEAIPGIMRDGGFAEFITSRTDVLVPIPDGVSFAQAAMGNDAGMTAHGGMIGAGKASRGDKVGIIGFGGLGQIGATVAMLAGCEIYVAEVKPDLWHAATELGARRVVGDVRDLDDVELDLIVDYAGFGTTTAGAIETVRDGGRVVQVGMAVPEATISTDKLIMKGVTLVGSLGGTLDDTRRIYELMASGDLSPTIEEIDFADIPAGLQRLSAGTVTGRLVATRD